MTFNWTDYLDFANQLCESPGSPDLSGLGEATSRSAVSRAYYAVYHCALSLACKEGFRPSSGGDHTDVQNYFRRYNPEDKLRGEVARELNLLRSRRNEADYDDRLEGTPGLQADIAVDLAKSIRNNLESIAAAGNNPDS
jgi:uncharacterized protein (UPF0332 family)